MYIKKITLENFRNYEKQSVEFENTLNVVMGKNASGKTNLIESIYCSSIGKSPRTNRFKELIRWGQSFARIKIELFKKYRSYTVEFVLDTQEKKRIAIDGIPLSKISELVGVINVVYFSPDELKLIKESPQERRRFMDISLSQQSKTYFFALTKYNEILDQRNKLLKTVYDKKKLEQMLFAWDIQLAKFGAIVIKNRAEFIKKLATIATNTHSYLTDGAETLVIDYESVFAQSDSANIEENFALSLSANIDKDMNLQYTSIGAHRDDISISINGVDARKFGSQGQQRTAALALKLAEIGLFKEQLGETPILLLDDVLSELDIGRREKLMTLASGMQTIITCTDFDMNVPHSTIFVNKGIISK